MLKLVSLFKSKVAALLALFAGVFGASVAFAQSAIDPTVVTNSVTANLATINTIGGAILGLVVTIVAYRWVRRIIK